MSVWVEPLDQDFICHLSSFSKLKNKNEKHSQNKNKINIISVDIRIM